MTCDDVFDSLTSSTPETSADLAAHLSGCPRCRDLVEVLAPLRGESDLFETPAQSQFDISRAPSAEAVEVARTAAHRLASAAQFSRPEPRRRGPTFLGHVSAFLAGAAASLCLAAGSSHFQSDPTPGPAQPICQWGRQLLENSQRQLAASDCQRCHAEKESLAPGDAVSPEERTRVTQLWRDLQASLSTHNDRVPRLS